MQLTYDMIKHDDNGSIKIEDKEFIIVNRKPYYNSIYKGHNKKEFFEAICVCLGNEIDEDGFTPAYEVHWEIKQKDKDFADWNNPISIEETNFYQIDSIQK